MCQTVIYRGEEIETIGALASALGASNVVCFGNCTLATLRDDRACLCSIDLDATATLSGLRAVQSDHDPMQYNLRRR